MVTILNDKVKESDEVIVIDVYDEWSRAVSSGTVTVLDDAGG